MQLVALTGASGSGKTTIARALADTIDVFHFDSISVPTTAQMVEQYGPGEAWQRAKTIDWFARLAEISGNILFEGQTRIAFLEEAAGLSGLANCKIVLVDCDDETRARRLIGERRQPELANPTMANWARFLRGEAARRGYPILDTSKLSLEESAERVRRYFT